MKKVIRKVRGLVVTILAITVILPLYLLFVIIVSLISRFDKSGKFDKWFEHKVKLLKAKCDVFCKRKENEK